MHSGDIKFISESNFAKNDNFNESYTVKYGWMVQDIFFSEIGTENDTNYFYQWDDKFRTVIFFFCIAVNSSVVNRG